MGFSVVLRVKSIACIIADGVVKACVVILEFLPGVGINNGVFVEVITCAEYIIDEYGKDELLIPYLFHIPHVLIVCIVVEMRKRMRKSIVDHDVLHDSLRKIFDILGGSDISDYDDIGWVDEGLWSPSGIVEGSVNYGNE